MVLANTNYKLPIQMMLIQEKADLY